MEHFFKIIKVIRNFNKLKLILFIAKLLLCISFVIPVSADIVNSNSNENSLENYQDPESKKSQETDKISVPKTEKYIQTISKPFGNKTVIKKSFSKNPNNPHKGLLLTGGTPSVYPSSEGRIIAVDKLEGYETVIIVDHGDNFYSVYGNLVEVFVSEGEFISKTTLLGNTSKLSGLYFQINQGTKSINPQSFFK